MPKRKQKPQRTCIVCREVKDKRALIRIVRTPEGKVVIDPTGKANGRGAYLCQQTSCWEKGLKTDKLAQALKVNISPEEAVELQSFLQTKLSQGVS